MDSSPVAFVMIFVNNHAHNERIAGSAPLLRRLLSI
jgi:hypothetical protein